MRVRLNLKKEHPKKTNKGAALITALFIMTIVAAAAVMMELQQSINIRRTSLMINADQASIYAQGVSFWAMAKLKENAVTSSDDAIIDSMPQNFPTFTRDDATVSGQVIDLQSRFNLNNLTQAKYVKHFTKLIIVIDPEIDEDLAEKIATATRDWVSKTRQVGRNKSNAEFSEHYLKQQPPYRAPHYPMASPSELRLVDGMTPELYQKLEPYISALPSFAKVNINTATAQVLSSLGDLSLKDAQSLVDDRSNELFPSTKEFMNNLKVIEAKINIKEITVVSEYFLSEAAVHYGNIDITEYSLIKREMSSQDEKKSANLSLLWTSQGAW